MAEPHPVTADIGYWSLAQTTLALRNGDVSSNELTSALLERISAIDTDGTPTSLCSIAAISPAARQAAQRCDAERHDGQVRGELHGVVVVIKDNIEAIDLPGTAGSTSLVGRPTRDSPLVSRLRDSGAIVLASTNLSQWANIRSPRSTSGWSATGGLVANPWALDRSPGGSSSGSGAALAAGLAPLAVGTETDGSIVCPASLNGVVGLKPTVGVVPAKRVVPISASQDSPGPMARCVDDVATLFRVLSGLSEPRGPQSPLRMGFASNWLVGHPETDELIASVVAELSSSSSLVTPVTVAEPTSADQGDELTVLLCELVDDLGRYLSSRDGDGVRSVADVVEHELAHREVELAHFGHEFFVRARDSGGRSSDEYTAARARNLEWALSTCLGPAFGGIDILLAASYGPAWKSDLALGATPGLSSCATMAPAIAGWPIMSVPVGLVHDLPVGLALIGRPNSEFDLLRIAKIVESAVSTSSFVRPLWTGPSRG